MSDQDGATKRPLEVGHDEDPPNKRVAGGESEEAQEVEEEQTSKGDANETVFRLLVPFRKVGLVIGKGGTVIKQLREDTGAKITVIDPPGGAQSDERVVRIAAREAGAEISPAQEALYKVYNCVAAEAVDAAAAPAAEGATTSQARLLVDGSQAGSVIGRGGEIVKTIRESSGANVRILPVEELPPCAEPTDRVIQMSGDAAAMATCLKMVSQQLRENPPKQMPQRSFGGGGARRMGGGGGMGGGGMVGYGMAGGAGGYGMPPMGGNMGGYAMPPMGGGYGMMPQFGMQGMYGMPQMGMPQIAMPQMSMSGGMGSMMGGGGGGATSVTLKVSGASIGSVIGKGGSNISQVRQQTGARVKVHEFTPGVPDRNVEITGTVEQVAAAQQMVQSFVSNAQATAPYAQSQQPQQQQQAGYAQLQAAYTQPALVGMPAAEQMHGMAPQQLMPQQYYGVVMPQQQYQYY